MASGVDGYGGAHARAPIEPGGAAIERERHACVAALRLDLRDAALPWRGQRPCDGDHGRYEIAVRDGTLDGIAPRWAVDGHLVDRAPRPDRVVPRLILCVEDGVRDRHD